MCKIINNNQTKPNNQLIKIIQWPIDLNNNLFYFACRICHYPIVSKQNTTSIIISGYLNNSTIGIQSKITNLLTNCVNSINDKFIAMCVVLC